MRNISEKQTAAQWLLNELKTTYRMSKETICKEAALRPEQLLSIEYGNNRFGILHNLLIAYCRLVNSYREAKENAGDHLDAYNSPRYENYADIRGGAE